MSEPIWNKAMMYGLLREGKLGNHFQLWESCEEFEASGFRGLTGVRTTTIRAPYWHHLTPHQALIAWDVFTGWGYTPVIYEASPDQHIVLQGEAGWYGSVADGRYGWTEPMLWLRYSRAKTHMRAALTKDNNYLEGRQAEILLRRAVGQKAWADFVWLWQTYPGHVIEFTAYDKPVGVDGHLAVVWEVRSY